MNDSLFKMDELHITLVLTDVEILARANCILMLVREINGYWICPNELSNQLPMVQLIHASERKAEHIPGRVHTEMLTHSYV